MNCYSPKEIADISIQKGVEKANLSKISVMLLAFLGGAFIALGYLAFIRVTGTMPQEWGGLVTLIGASVFPIGLICILLGGGELLTGNMMAVSIAYYAKKVSFKQLMGNWLLVAFFNFLGALFVAYFFGHFVGLAEGVFLEKTIATAQGKVNDPFWVAFVSGVGCNWLVSIAVWLSFGAKDVAGKIMAIWFPTMIFVLIGFQHVVANMFIIPAAIFAGALSWVDFMSNVIPVFLGNAIGGAVFVSLIYFAVYCKKDTKRKGIVVKNENEKEMKAG